MPLITRSFFKLPVRKSGQMLVLGLASVLLPAALHAQVTYTGTVATETFGATGLGGSSSAHSFSFSVHSGTTVGSIAVLTQGVANKDYADAGTSTCTAKTYATTATCTVSVKFSPHAPGTRNGAVVFYNAAGTPSQTVFLTGSGLGSEAAYLPGKLSLSTSSSSAGFDPTAIALDATGNLYVADFAGNQVLEISTTRQKTVIASGIGSTNYAPHGIAVDGAGNVYVAVYNGSATLITLGYVEKYSHTSTGFVDSGSVGLFTNPTSVTVDGAGNIYVGDTGRIILSGLIGIPGIDKVTPAGAQTAAISLNLNVLQPYVDAVGDLYFFSVTNHIVEYTPTGLLGAYVLAATFPNSGLASQTALLRNPAGNFYVLGTSPDDGAGEIVEMTPAGVVTVVSHPSAPAGIRPLSLALDGSGNLFTEGTDDTATTYSVLKFSPQQPGALTFSTPTAGGTTDTADGPQTTTIENIGNSPLTVLSVQPPVDFPLVTGASNACTNGGSVVAGSACTVTVNFKPVAAGGTGTSSVIDEGIKYDTTSLNTTLNSTYGALIGTASKFTPTAVISTPNPSPVAGTPVTYTVTVTGTGPVPTGMVQFYIGNVYVGTSTIFEGGVTQFTTSSLPTGIHTTYAKYLGDSTYTAITTSKVAIDVVK